MAGSDKRTELTVGLFMLIGLGLLAALILQFGRFQDRLEGHYTLTVVFDDASGVIKGSEVRMGGARIGKVAELPELNEAVQVEIKLAITKTIRIPAGAAFHINSATLLGDKLIDITPPVTKNGQYIEPGSRLNGAGAGGIDALQNNAQILSQDVSRMLKEAEVTMKKIDAAVDEIQGASKSLGEAIGKINRSLLAEDNLQHIDNIVKNVDDISVDWKKTTSEAREAIASVKSAAARAEKTLDTADQTIAAARPAIERIPGAVTSFTRTVDKAGDTLDRMRRGEGMLGAFASDNEVAFDFKAFMKNLRQHGILRYKDSAGNPTAARERSAIKGRPN